MEKLPSPSINLAKNRGAHLSDRILGFALTIGRVLVIITEAIALGAFLFRFGLDRQLVDLHDRIQQEQAIVTILKKQEASYRNLQDRLTLENSLVNSGTTNLKLFQDLSNMIPSDMSLTSLYFSSTTIEMQASIPSLVSLSSFVKSLQSDSRIQRVSLDKIENKTEESALSVNMTIYLKSVANKPLL